jgi:two-component system, NarL family, sensor histidine kinase BarA
MSLRAFKRLLGESSLERKCRFLLGGGILVLVSCSFWLYAWQTERIAFDQIVTGGRLLVHPFLSRLHLEPKEQSAMEAFNKKWEGHWVTTENNYQYELLKSEAKDLKHRPAADEIRLMEQFRDDPEKPEEVRINRSKEKIYYYAPIRIEQSCLQCHPRNDNERQEMPGDWKENSLMAVVRFDFNTEAVRGDLHTNRAYLITNALVTALLIVAGSYVIIRYVIVKPVRHLKEVSNAIADGKMNVRSDIHTGDEFEDLSYSFNRMLMNLASTQERLKSVNVELDGKIDELAKANLALYESNRLKSDFLTTMSHELRTPLNSILGFSDLLLNNGEAGDKVQRWILNIQTGGQQLLALINDVLDLAKMEAGKMQVRAESFAVGEVIETVIASLRPLAERKNIDLRQQLDPGLPPLFQDAGKVRQILSNLVSNALKFTPEGGRVLVKARTADDFIVIDVIDNGVGIAPEEQEAVFEKFRQAATPLTREHEGSGLGLSIVRELSKLLGGDVNLQSELGRGSTFTVRLPVRLPTHLQTEAAR